MNQPSVKVRYSGFSEPEPPASKFRTRSLKRKKVVGPSGHNYSFRQKGRPSNSNSQWLPVRSEKDREYFEGRDGFELQRER